MQMRKNLQIIEDYFDYLGIVMVSTIWLSVSRRSDMAGIPDR